MKIPLPESDLIINPDGSIYHLKLKPGEVADKIITVGDPDRVEQVSAHFDKIEFSRHSREFKTVTGIKNSIRLTVISTGIGTDNIDIVLNELDMLVNMDFKTRLPNAKHKRLQFFRLGTSGAIHRDIPMDTILISKNAYGLDALGRFYEAEKTNETEIKLFGRFPVYFTEADSMLFDVFSKVFQNGNTLTMPGFYNPQGRKSRLKNKVVSEIEQLFNRENKHGLITNIEMETSGIYLLSKYYGHQAISINAILANRVHQTYSEHPEKTILQMIEKCIDIILEI